MKLRQVLNWVGLVIVLAVNGLANALPLNGKTTGEISDNIPTLFTPAGYVFSIWSLIYLGLLAFAWYQGRRAQATAEFQERIGYWFFVSCVFNSAWIVAWHYEQFPLSLAIMLGLLVSLLAIYLRLDIGRRSVSAAENRAVHLPFSIYLGWISVATIANVSTVLYQWGWTGGALGPEIWTAIMVVIAGVLGIAMIVLRHEIGYPLVIVWALVGIWVARRATPLVANASAATAVIVALMLIVAQVRARARPAVAA
jgi:benzodiazapine receptor